MEPLDNHWAVYGIGLALIAISAGQIIKSYFSPGHLKPTVSVGSTEALPPFQGDTVKVVALPMLTELQREAVNLSMTIVGFLQGLGKPPKPKYTREDIEQMSTDRTMQLINSGDVPYMEACEFFNSERDPLAQYQRSYYPGELGRWFDRVRSEYALTHIGTQVEKLRHMFAVKGFNTDELLIPVEGRFSLENGYRISAALWNLAYQSRN